jgi:hypothetical protein
MATFSLFGWEFKRKELKDTTRQSFTPEESNDGAVLIAAGSGYGTYVDLDGTVRTEAELVTKYREMSLHPECDAAIDEIINESMSIDEDKIVTINLDEVDIADKIKNSVKREFNYCMKLLDFKNHAYDIYRRWYIDGRLYYHVMIDRDKPREGIKELRYIDPRKIRKIREISRKRAENVNPGDGASILQTVNEYFIYNDKGFNYGNKVVGPSTVGLKIAKDSVLHVVSGLTDNQGTMVLSYLHKAIKALNQLRTLEDALVIYRLSRAPERRIWYIDVGNLPKMKAEQYVRDIMVRHKNRLIYDASSGEIRDDRKFMTMLEDYWLPRREGGRGTEVTTLPGGQTLGQMDDVLYFQKKFLNALNVPISRLNAEASFSLGRATEITRDELKFAKFVIRLRSKFSILFNEILKRQLVLKGVMSLDEWDAISTDIRYDYAKDNYFTELKDGEIAMNRVNLARNFQDMLGKYYSHEWVRRTILRQTDDDIREMDSEIEAEDKSGEPRWINPAIVQAEQMMEAVQAQQEQMDALAQQSGSPGSEGPGGAPAGPDQGQPPPGAVSSDAGISGGNQDSGFGYSPPVEAEDAQKLKQIHDAINFVRLMKQKDKGSRSMQEQSKYNSAVQLIAKNREFIKKHAIQGAENAFSAEQGV